MLRPKFPELSRSCQVIRDNSNLSLRISPRMELKAKRPSCDVKTHQHMFWIPDQ